MGSEGQPVRFRDCTCPETPHSGQDGADDGDIVYMRPVLGFAAGAQLLRVMGEAVIVVSPTGGGKDGTEPILDQTRSDELVGPVLSREGATGWNVVDETGPVPLDIDAILGNYAWAYPIAEKGAELYTEAVLVPLVKRMNGLSGHMSSSRPTSATRRSSTKARSPRSSSSQNGSVGRPSPVSR
jgi:hypothetical protein